MRALFFVCLVLKVNISVLILLKKNCAYGLRILLIVFDYRHIKENRGVFFEEQNIHTISTDGELVMTILASYAQAESLSASENQKWRIRKAFENGEIVNLRFLFGYRINGAKIEIDPAQADIVREVFERAVT